MAMNKKKPNGTAEIISFNKNSEKVYDTVRERDNNVIGSQIQAAREARGYSLSGFAELLSQYGLTIHRQGIGKWEAGISIPNAYQLLAICHALRIEDGISYFTRVPKKPDELNIEGWNKLAEYKALLVASGRYKPVPPVKKVKMEYVSMDLSFLPVSAGPGEFLSEDSFEKVRFPASAVPAGADFGIRVSGDSMEPVYQDGQIVWVQKCESLNPGDVGIFEYDGSGYLKVYDEQEPDESAIDDFTTSDGVLCMQPVLVSYNEKYDPIVISPNTAFHIAGKVLN